MASKNARIPNPSGTAATFGVSVGIGGLLSLASNPNFLASAVSGLATGGTMATITELLTNKRFLDLALDYAEKPTLAKEINLNKFIKDKTGYSAVALRSKLLDESNKDDK